MVVFSLLRHSSAETSNSDMFKVNFVRSSVKKKMTSHQNTGHQRGVRKGFQIPSGPPALLSGFPASHISNSQTGLTGAAPERHGGHVFKGRGFFPETSCASYILGI